MSSLPQPRRHFSMIRGFHLADFLTLGNAACGTAAVMLAMVLYPYVYLLCRNAFQQQSVCLLEASRALGHSLGASFLRLALPMARPAIVGGVALALMETLAERGATSFAKLDV